jgi:hypothetical protein
MSTKIVAPRVLSLRFHASKSNVVLCTCVAVTGMPVRVYQRKLLQGLLWILDNGCIYTYLYTFFYKYLRSIQKHPDPIQTDVHAHKCLHYAVIEPATSCVIYIETLRSNTPRHVHAHKCLHCAGIIEPAASCVVDEYFNHYAKSANIACGHVRVVDSPHKPS